MVFLNGPNLGSIMARTPLLRFLQKHFRSHPAVCNAAEDFSASTQNLISRRSFVAGSGALLLGAALPKSILAVKKEKRIAIVGGGISGLSCALKLADHGVKATVYEASPRLGGRMFSNTGYWNEDQISEWCGELIDTGHKTIQKLAGRFNLKLDNLIEAEPKGSEGTFYFDGQYYPKAQFLLDVEPVIGRVLADLKDSDFPTTYEKSTPGGRDLDKISVYDWIESRVSGGHASPLGQLLDTAYAIEYGADTTDQSALNLIYLLGYQPPHGETALFGVSDETYHIRGGNEELPRAIAKELGPDRFVLGRQLVSLEKLTHEGLRLTFKTSSGGTEEVVADCVVLALPFSVLRDIDISNAGFDTLKLKAIQELGRGRNGKTQLQFQQRTWNQVGTWPGIGNGDTYSDTGYQSSWEVTRAQKGVSGILNFFSGGSVTEKMETTQPFTSSGNPQAQKDAKAALAAGEVVFPTLTRQWNGKLTQSIPHLSPFMRASYAYYRVGQYSSFGGYEGAAQGQVFFAGDHCSQDFQGYMEGAASEGERAADEVLKH